MFTQQSLISRIVSGGIFGKYIRNTSWLMLERVVQLLIGLGVSVFVARYLGPERLGLLSYANSMVGLFIALSTLGLDSLVIRELVTNPEKKCSYLGTAFVLKLFGAVIMWLVMLCVLPFVQNDAQSNLLIGIIGFSVIFQSLNVIDFSYQAEVKSKLVVQVKLVHITLSSILKISLVYFQAPLHFFAWVYCFDGFVLAIGLLVAYQKNSGDIRDWFWDRNVAYKLLRDSWPLIFSGMVLMLQARVDQVMLKHMIGAGEVGQYSVALRIVEAVAFLPVILKSSITPLILDSKAITSVHYRDRLLNYYRLTFLSFVILAIPLYYVAELLVLLLYGEEFRYAGGLLALMSFRLFFSSMGTARSVFILAENLFRYSLITMILGTAVNVGLNFILIPNHQASGAIYSTYISFFVTIFLIDFFHKTTAGNVVLMFKGIFTFYNIFNYRQRK